MENELLSVGVWVYPRDAHSPLERCIARFVRWERCCLFLGEGSR